MRAEHNADDVAGRSDLSFETIAFHVTEEELSGSATMLIKIGDYVTLKR